MPVPQGLVVTGGAEELLQHHYSCGGVLLRAVKKACADTHPKVHRLDSEERFTEAQQELEDAAELKIEAIIDDRRQQCR